MTTKNLILATAGHVDHGKTALIKALTGADTDRLPEEKARGITIDLGFARLELPGLSLGIIDVPGHEDFIRNMIAGLGAIDLALLVVAADDGWMPQTEEHLQILSYLGVTRMVVALTKSDLGRTAQRCAEIRQALRGTTFAEGPIIETSIREPTSILLLQEALAAECRNLPEQRDSGKPRLFVDRVFTVRGSGTVVTGTLSGGQLLRGAKVQVFPQKLQTRIRAIQSHNQPLEVAEPGTRTALNLADVAADEVTRGGVVALPEVGEPSLLLDVVLERSNRLPPSTRPLKSGSILTIHHGSARIRARVQLRDRKLLLPNEKAIARLLFRSPLLAFAGDRFILRDASEQTTVAGGFVLDPEPGEIKLRSSPQRALLDERLESPNDCNTFLRTQLQRDHFARHAQLLPKSPFSPDKISAALKTLQTNNRIFLDDKIAADWKWWREIRESAAKLVEAEHAAHPEQSGLEISRLRETLRVGDAEVFDALFRDLVKGGFTQTRTMIQRTSHRPSLPPALREAGEQIRTTLAAQPYNPPSRKELAPDLNSERALRFLTASREVVETNKDVVLGADAFAKMKNEVVAFIQQNGPATAGQLREALGSSRRIMVPFLEYLDREGVTRRSGDQRALANPGRR